MPITFPVSDAGGHTTLASCAVSLAASDFDRIVTGDQPNGLHVPEGQAWKLEGLVTTPKNVINEGLLVARSGMTLRFRDVNESLYVGGGLDPQDSDVGLWVIGNGMLDFCGTTKAGWNRIGTDPTWAPGDEIRICPTAVGDYTNFPLFTPGSPVPQLRPWLPPTEVFNLTRDCSIEGTPTGRAHIFIRSMMPQDICHTQVRYMGPRKNGKFILGRWGLHFHHCMGGSRGTNLESLVIRDCNSHAFVPHMSDGIRAYDFVTFNNAGDHYWWDDLDFTNDCDWQHCLAALGSVDPENSTALSGFLLGRGDGNKARDVAAVGVGKGANGGGVNWAERAASAMWLTDDVVAHNNPKAGARSWQNQGGATDPSPTINRLASYRNGGAGMAHGAYINSWQFNDSSYLDNVQGATTQAAQSGNHGPIRHVRTRTEGPPITIVTHATDAVSPLVYEDAMITLNAGVAVEVKQDPPANPGIRNPTRADFVRAHVNGNGELEPSMIKLTYFRQGGVIRVQRNNGTAYKLEPGGVVTPIPAFA